VAHPVNCRPGRIPHRTSSAARARCVAHGVGWGSPGRVRAWQDCGDGADGRVAAAGKRVSAL
jgi:hypothetical protein